MTRHERIANRLDTLCCCTMIGGPVLIWFSQVAGLWMAFLGLAVFVATFPLASVGFTHAGIAQRERRARAAASCPPLHFDRGPVFEGG